MKPVLHYWALVLCASLSATVAKHFIVELETTHNLNPRSFRRALDSVSSSLKRSNLKHEITRTFTTDGIFHGLAVKLNDATPEDAKTLAAIPGVKSIRPSSYYKAPKPAQMQIVTDLNAASSPVGSESTLTMIGADKVHADGIVGDGVKIGIIDTGIDYTHPTLGGTFGQGSKVSGGYDFVGDAFTGAEISLPTPDHNPLDTCNGHGTMVAGIIGANPGNGFNITGVAFGASLSAYRVYGCTGGTRDELVIDALLQAVKDKQNIIVLSLGEPSGWTESAVAVIVDRIVGSGIIVIAAVGDNGAAGSWYAASPSTGKRAISVASVDNTKLPVRNATVNGPNHAPIPYVSLLPLNTTDPLFIYATSTNTSIDDDACKPLPDNTPDLSTFLVVIRRGNNCTSDQKIGNVAAKGGKFALIYNNDDSPLSLSIAGGNVSAGGITAADGLFLVQQFAANVSTSLSFPQDNATDLNDPHGGLMSDFSSYGPSIEQYFKPAVSAPGGHIITIVPVNLGAFVMASGTSMATSFVAGSAALVLSSKGKTKQTATGILSLFESTAQKVPSSTNSSDPLQTLTQQGAGLINVSAAINTATIISTTELLLNSTAHFKADHAFVVKNNGSKAKNYTLQHVPAGTAITIQPGSIFPANGPVPQSSNFATVEITPSNFILQPGKTQRVWTKFTEPTGLDPKTLPVYSGFIEVNSDSDSGSPGPHVVYQGMVGNLKDQQVLDNTSSVLGFQLPAIINGNNYSPQTQFTNYTYNGTDYPSVLIRMIFPSPILKIDLVDASTKISSGSFSPSSMLTKTFVPRNDLDFSQNGFPISLINMKSATFPNGSIIPNGDYRFLFRGLRVTGNPKDDKDYDSALSASFGIRA